MKAWGTLRGKLAFGAAALGVAVVSVGFCALVADTVMHESTYYIRQRMKDRLSVPRLPTCVPGVPPLLLPRLQSALTAITDKLTLLIGPTGAGKSTLLKEIARLCVTGTDQQPPTTVVLLQFRQPRDSDGDEPTDSASEMDRTATRIFEQIGFPMRRSLLGDLFARGFTWAGFQTQADLFHDSSRRLQMALDLLFDVLEEISFEQLPNVPKPVLLLDEVHDLIKDERLASVGGKRIFHRLGSRIVLHSVDNKSIRVIAAGSSAEILLAFLEGKLLHDSRLRTYTLADPEPGGVIAALTADGRYTAEEAASIVDLCGTRMRVLSEALGPKQDVPSYADFVESKKASATTSFTTAFELAAKSGQRDALALLLEDVEAAESTGTPFPGRYRLLPVFGGALPSSILFMDATQRLRFQSQLHRRVWAELRSQYLPRSGWLALSGLWPLGSRAKAPELK